MQGISSPAENRFSSPEGLCCMEYERHIMEYERHIMEYERHIIPNSGTHMVAVLVLWMAGEQIFEATFDKCHYYSVS
jgi:hypothetical protein